MATKLTSAGRVPLTDEELADYNARSAEYEASKNDRAAAEIRLERNARLLKSDWVTLRAIDQNAQDSLGVQIPQIWLDYRQALRDVTTQDGFPHNITWPAEP